MRILYILYMQQLPASARWEAYLRTTSRNFTLDTKDCFVHLNNDAVQPPGSEQHLSLLSAHNLETNLSACVRDM